MSHQDQFETERHRVERVLEILDRIATRLDARGYVPLSLLSDAVEFVRASEEAAYEASQSSEGEPPLSACVEQHIAARAPVLGMQQALDAFEAGDTAAAERFAQFARAYVALRRDHLRLDDRLFAKAPHATEDRAAGVPGQAESPATRRIYHRLIEASAALARADESKDRAEPPRTQDTAASSRH
jgi:hemerythrin-like domain-containing protein